MVHFGPLLGWSRICMPAGSNPKVCFGDFQLDARTRELRNNGHILKLQEQPFQVLTALLERPGQLVTREELKARLWASDTFVDFERSLNKAVNRLREALGESADTPIFVETVPKLGYRFIPSVGARGDGAGAPTREVVQSNKWKLLALPVIALAVMAGSLSFAYRWLRFPAPAPSIVAWKQITNDGQPKVGRLVNDGARIYFGETSSGHNILKQVSVAGGDPAVVPTPLPDPLLEDISPEQSELLVQAGKDQEKLEGTEFWLIPILTGSPRRLGDIVGRAGIWAPTPGGQFAFSRDKELYVASHDGSDPHRIVTAPSHIWNIHFSPDGSNLRFSTYEVLKDTVTLWEVRSDGSGLHPLLPGWNSPAREVDGNWTPNGQNYFFQSVRDGISNLWMKPERTGIFHRVASRQPVQLTAGPFSFTSPVSSKDGKQLFAIGTHLRGELVRYDKKTGNWVPFLGGISAGDVDFSRDGKWVSYITYPDDSLWRSRADGSERLQLTFPPMRAALVHWSPDGQRIAFSAMAPGKTWKVWLISRDGGTAQQLTSDEVVEFDPNWSPDGNTLAFGLYLSGSPDRSSIQLFDLKTHKSSRLPGSAGLWNLSRWSPDGRYLATTPFDSKELMLFDFNTRKWRQLVAGLGMIGYFSWSPDSAYLYFSNLFSDNSAYLRVRISDSRLERIASFKGIRLFSADFPDFEIPWSGLAPGEIPLLVRDTGTQEIYALDWRLP